MAPHYLISDRFQNLRFPPQAGKIEQSPSDDLHESESAGASRPEIFRPLAHEILRLQLRQPVARSGAASQESYCRISYRPPQRGSPRFTWVISENGGSHFNSAYTAP